MMIDALKWTTDTDRKLRFSAGADLSLIRASVKQGKAQLYRLTDNKTDLHVVARGEDTELVIVCVEGRGMKSAGPALIKAAKSQGFKTIRYHCQNPAVQRLYQRYGFAGCEYERVYKIELE